MNLFERCIRGIAVIVITATLLSSVGFAKINVVEIWHYWMGAEKTAIDALVQGFEEQTGIKVEQRTVPGTSAQLRQQLGLAFLAGEPPETFQAGIGYRLKSYADSGRLLPITDIWNAMSGDSVFIEKLIPMVKFSGKVWAVPLNIHVINNVWYNVYVFERYGLEPPKTWEEFGRICEVLKQNGIAPIAAAGGWVLYPLYPFLITTLGPEGYIDIGRGKVSFTSDQVREAFELYKQYWIANLMSGWSGYATWVDPLVPFLKGEVAMYFCMGDWLAAVAAQKGAEPLKDFDYFPAPGTANLVIGQVDAFPLLNGCDDSALGKEFLAFSASPQGQALFNKYKGSLAANKLTPTDIYDPVMTKEFKTLTSAGVTFLPNLFFMWPPDAYEEFRVRVQEYAMNPTAEVLDRILGELEAMRQEMYFEGKWVDWEW